MLTCIIIDDEKHSRETTEMLLKMIETKVKILSMEESAAAGALAINRHNPDFILLDIQMPEISGIEMIDLIPNYQGEIIFVTAYDNYAIEAFKKGALHYLLKPIDEEDLQEAISRINKNEPKDKSSNKNDGEWLSVSTQEGWVVLKKSDIIRCESYKNYTTIITINDKHTISKSLGEVQKNLPAENFYRVHHSHLVNVTHAQKVLRGDGGNVLMVNDDLIPISKNRKKEFFDWFQVRMHGL